MKTQLIKNFENYTISDDGEVVNIKTGKTLATQCNTKGYKTVNLWKNNKLTKKLIHRLVAEHFIENKNNLPCVNHIDKNKLNNNAINLEWCTYKDNSQHSLKEIIEARAKVGRKVKVKQLVNGKWIQYESINDASRQTGASVTTIRTTLRKLFKCPKMIWEYVNSVTE